MATKKETSASSGPFWVQDKKGNKFVWPFVPEGASDTGESHLDVLGNVRPNEPSTGLTNPAQATTEGNVP